MVVPDYMIDNLSLVFENFSYSDWACEKAYTALFVYYPDIVNKKAIPKIYEKLGGYLDKETGNYFIDKPTKPEVKKVEVVYTRKIPINNRVET